MSELAIAAILFCAAGVLAWAATWGYLSLPARWRALAVPNERSSHVRATPNGGGLSIALVLVIAAFAGVWLGLSQLAALQLVGAVLIIAVVGALDDRRSLSVGVRLASHSVAGVLVVAATGPLPEVTIFGVVLAFGPTTYWLVSVLLVLVLVNFYNFMDGIDGLAAGQAVSVALGALLALAGVLAPMAQFMLLAIAGSCVGFLYWNWSPARVFMGDVSSGTLGLVFGVLILATANDAEWVRTPQPFWFWLVLLDASLVAASVTLIRRSWRRQRIWAGHREHAYQHAAARWGHRRVTVSYLAINTVWLWPLALWVVANPALGFWIWCVATVPLVIGAVWAGAGSANRIPAGGR